MTRPKGNDFVVQTAKFPSLKMNQESNYDVWVYPHGDDRACKRLVDCANKYLHGELDAESALHTEKRMAMQTFCSGREHTAMPKPLTNSFDKSNLTAEQLSDLEALLARCSEDQRAVLDKIFSCQSAVHIVQGPPGTAKTSFAAQILIPILDIFGLSANCYASSNAATDVFADKIPKELKPIRYHGLGKEKLGLDGFNEVEHRSDVPDYNAEGLSEDEIVWLTVLTAATLSDSWLKPGKMVRPNFFSKALYIRAFQLAGVMNAQGELAKSLPATVPGKYMKWAKFFYKVGMHKEYYEDADNVAVFKNQTQMLFEDAMNAAKFVITTCSNAADETLRKHTAPDVVIVDEAGVAKELETMMAMYHNLSSAWLYITLGDHKQLPPTVPSLHMKRVIGDDSSPPYNIFAMQVHTSLMTRLLDSGIEYSMFRKQFRMTAGLQEFSSRLCYGGSLQNADCTLLARREKSQDAIKFLNEKFGLVTDIPHLCMNVETGVCLNSRTKSRYNLPNVIIDMYIIELVVEAGVFKPEEITIITPYKEQASSIRQAMYKASLTDFWRERDIKAIKVHTVDSMQGNESQMVITDFVMAKKRKGKFGFVTNRGRINVSMSRAKCFQVFVGDLTAADPKDAPAEDAPAQDAPAEVDDKNDDAPNEDVHDEADQDEEADEDDEEEVFEKPSYETSDKPIKMLFDHYKESNVVVNTVHTDKPQQEYVDLTETNVFLAGGVKTFKCRNCEQPGHIAKDCPQPNLKLRCHRCNELGHKAQQCSLPKPDFCFECKKEGHKRPYCPGMFTVKEYQVIDHLPNR